MVNRVMARKLARDLLQKKGALLALVAIVAAGVGIYVSMAAVYLDLDGARARYYDRYRLADFTVDLKRAPEWTLKSVATLPNVIEVRGRINQAVLLDLKNRVEPIPGAALSMPRDQALTINGVMMRSGIWFSGEDAKEAILEHQFATAVHLKPGDRIKVTLLDKQHELLVVGTAMSPEFVYLIPPGGGLSPDPAAYGVMYLPRKFLQNSGDLDGAYNQLVGLTRDSSRDALADTLELIKEELDPYGVTNSTPIHDQASASVLRDELLNIKTTAAIFPVIFLGVAALVLNILMGRIVAQHRGVIGTLRALGYYARDITLHYLGYGVVVGLLGGFAGIAFGWWLQGAMLGIYRDFFAMPGIEPHFHGEIFFIGLAIAVVFALLGAFKGGRRAARLEPAEAMRPPPPEKGGAVLLERLPAFWNRLSFRWRMIFRAIFRNPFRSSVSVIASAVSTGLIVASFSMYDSTYYLMDYHFQKIAHEDRTISLRDPKGVGSASEISGLPTVSLSEAQLAVVCDLRNGPYERRTAVTGLPRNGDLYTPLDRAGRRVVIPNQGMIITRRLGEILNVDVGDQIQLRPLIARRKQVAAPVVGMVDTFLGLSMYCDIHYLSSLLGEYWVGNSFLLSSFPGGSAADLMKQIRKRPGVIGIADRKRSLAQMHKTIGQFMASFFAFTVIFAGIIAFGSLLNTALVSLSEREREVGTFRVLGYSSSQVTQIFAGESLVLNGVGIALGLWLGIGVAHLLSMAFNTDLYRFPAIVYSSRLLFAAVLMVFFVACAQFIVYRMICHLEWLEVLKVKE